MKPGVDNIDMLGVFREAEERYNTKGRLGIITYQSSAQDVREIGVRILAILGGLHRILLLWDAFLSNQ